MFLPNGVDIQVLWKDFLYQLETNHLINKLQAHKAIKISVCDERLQFTALNQQPPQRTQEQPSAINTWQCSTQQLQEKALQGDLCSVEHKCICVFKQNVFIAF